MPDPDGYPDPAAHLARYEPVTPDADARARQHLVQHTPGSVLAGERAAVRHQLAERNDRQPQP